MSLPCGVFNETYAQDMAIVRTKAHWGLFALALVFLFILPFLPVGYGLNFAIKVGITLVVALGMSILTGLCGQISLGHAAFMAIGAFTSAHMMRDLGVNFLITLPCAGLAAGLVGLVFGAPSLRVKGLYLALATLAAQFIIHYCLVHFWGGDCGVHASPPSLAGISLASDTSIYYIVVIIALILGLAAQNIARTMSGRAFVAIRDNDIAAEVMGVNIFRYKLLAFFTGCFYAGVGGALWVFYVGAANADHFTIFDSVWYLGIILIGGLGSILGVVLGTVFVRGIEEIGWLIAPTLGNAFPGLGGNFIGALPEIFLGLAVLLFIIFEPRGLAHRWEIFKTSYRVWPFAHW